MANNKYPISQFEEQQFLSEEQKIEQIEKILNKFEQPIPSNFIPTKVEHVGSTKPSWEGKVPSERYFFTYKGKEYQIDIPHTLMEKLELEKGEDITQPFYLDPKVLTSSETYRGISINEGEILIQQSFTINNLEQNLNKLFEQIEKLEEKEKSNQKTITNLKKELSEKEKTKSDWKNEWLTEWRKKNNLEKEIQPLLQELTGEKQMGQSQKNVYHQKTQNLQNQLNQVQNERDSFLQKIEELEKTIDERDNKINRLTNEKGDIKRELDRELSWWDKWINAEIEKKQYDRNYHDEEEWKYLIRNQDGNEHFTSSNLNVSFTYRSGNFASPPAGDTITTGLYYYSNNKSEIKKGKQLIKSLHDYYTAINN